MAGEAKRKFLSLDVGEISLVDEPANESPVAVMKRKEQTQMANPAAADNKTPVAEDPGTSTEVSKTADGQTSTPDVEQVEQETEADASVIKRLLTQVELLVAKSTETPTETETEKAKPNPVEAAKEAKQAKVDALKAALKKAGMSDGDIAKAVTAAFGSDTKKSVEAPSTEEVAMDTLEALGLVVAKAKKFTPKRMAELAKAAETIQALLADLQPTEPASDATVAKSTGTPAPSEVEKSKDSAPDVAALIEAAVTKAVAPLQSEIETLKSTRAPSTAGGDDGDPVSTTEVKTEKNFWAGVVSPVG